jgi:hypothetical protein
MAILERMSVEFGVVAKAIERLAPPPFSPLATSLCGVEEYDLRWSSPAGDLVTTLGRQILKSNGLASSYSQFKWKFSIKTTQPKTLKIVEPNSQAMMAPDTRQGSRRSSAPPLTPRPQNIALNLGVTLRFHRSKRGARRVMKDRCLVRAVRTIAIEGKFGPTRLRDIIGVSALLENT